MSQGFGVSGLKPSSISRVRPALVPSSASLSFAHLAATRSGATGQVRTFDVNPVFVANLCDVSSESDAICRVCDETAWRDVIAL